MNAEEQYGSRDRKNDATFKVRLPGFVSDTEIGLGDLVSRAAASVSIRPCGGCARRAAALNQWIAVSPWRYR
jgi:hypothetical protein